MQNATAIVEQSPPKWLARSPKRDSIDELSIARPESSPYMIFADGIDISEGMCRRGEQWRGIAGAEGACARQHVREKKIDPASRNRPVNPQCCIAARNRHRRGECVFEKSAKSSQRVLFQRDAGGHGVSP